MALSFISVASQFSPLIGCSVATPAGVDPDRDSRARSLKRVAVLAV